MPTIKPSTHNAEGVCHFDSVLGSTGRVSGGGPPGRSTRRSSVATRSEEARRWVDEVPSVENDFQRGWCSVRFQTSTTRRTAGSTVARSRR